MFEAGTEITSVRYLNGVVISKTGSDLWTRGNPATRLSHEI